MKAKGIVVATAVAAALAMGGCAQRTPDQGHAQMKDVGYTKASCRGHNHCSGRRRTNSCKGQNSCSGRR